MKFTVIFVLLLLVFVVFTSAQRRPRPRPRQPRCVAPRTSSCSGPRDVGSRGSRRRPCRAHNMFYYDAARRQCIAMQYLGCGGNNNRWCSQAACQRRCRR